MTSDDCNTNEGVKMIYARRATKLFSGCWRYRGYVIHRFDTNEDCPSFIRWEIVEGEGEYSGDWYSNGQPMFKQLGDARIYIDRIIREGEVEERV